MYQIQPHDGSLNTIKAKANSGKVQGLMDPIRNRYGHQNKYKTNGVLYFRRITSITFGGYRLKLTPLFLAFLVV